jgi:hypothetical protein
MREIDSFASLLLEEAKYFLAKSDDLDEGAKNASLHVALQLAFSSLEAHVNSMASEFATRSDVNIWDKSVLLEKDMRLEDGVFRLTNQRFFPIQERILFLHNRFAKKPAHRNSTWWSALGSAITSRNDLTHPKRQPPLITSEAVTQALQAVIDTLDSLFRAVYNRKFPSADYGLNTLIAD